MMSSTVWGASCLVVLLRCARSAAYYHSVESHPLPVAPMSGQPIDAALLSCTIAPYPHILQVIMTLPIRSSCRCLGNT
jgi:hypothetical protein